MPTEQLPDEEIESLDDLTEVLVRKISDMVAEELEYMGMDYPAKRYLYVGILNELKIIFNEDLVESKD